MVDTNAIFNQALAYESAGDSENSIAKYESLIAMDYNRPEIYRYLSSLKKKSGDLDGAIVTAQAGMAKFPNNKEIILDNMAFLLEADRSEEAEGLVGVAIEKDPQNAVLYSVQGSLFDQKAAAAETKEEVMSWYDKAEASYKKSIEVDENFFDAYFNIGVLYNNRAAYIYEEIKDIKSDKEYMKAKKEADDIFLAAVPFFEKAHEIQPEDQQTIAQLVKLYGKTGDEEKYKEMKAKLAE
jgi:tetratricopeptide (TPR) repeat protein